MEGHGLVARRLRRGAGAAPPAPPLPNVLRRRTPVREIAFVVVAWLVYFGVRAFTEGGHAAAAAHGRAVLSLEGDLGVAFERGLQRRLIDHEAVVTLANWIYIWGHWPLIAATAIWLFRRHPDGYELLRNAMFLSGAAGLLVFAFYPVMPPRLLGGFLDSVTTYSHSYRALQPPSLTNPYAAFPSLHVGWDLLVGVMLVRHAARPAIRALGALMPLAMAFAVVATANHYVLDVAGGVLFAVAGLLLAQALGRREASVDSGPMARTHAIAAR